MNQSTHVYNGMKFAVIIRSAFTVTLKSLIQLVNIIKTKKKTEMAKSLSGTIKYSITMHTIKAMESPNSSSTLLKSISPLSPLLVEKKKKIFFSPQEMPLILFTGKNNVEASVKIKKYKTYEWISSVEERGVDILEHMLNCHIDHKALEIKKFLCTVDRKDGPDDSELTEIYTTLTINVRPNKD